MQILGKIRVAREQTDHLFELVRSEALYDRPIPERHRLIFYVGHLEAFDWNTVCRRDLGLKSFHPEFDRLFEFGIDPKEGGELPADRRSDWPDFKEIDRYRAQTRDAVDRAFAQATDLLPFLISLEHRLMHAETLAYLIHRLSPDQKIRRVDPVDDGPEPAAFSIDIPAGDATLGRDRPEKGESDRFGWDNEFSTETIPTAGFSIDAYNVTNGSFLKFVRDGGYEQRSLWSEAAWNWIQRNELQAPNFWRQTAYGWMYETMFELIPLPSSWPVYVSHAEAQAYARWQGRALPTEAQYHRAAFATRAGGEQSFPWGDAAPAPDVHGNFDAIRWNPQPVGSHPEGRSALGVEDLMSNGWEWTSTVFAPLPGFMPYSLYPGYSADFFDGEHYVLKGASPRTSAQLLRRSFRNWFQPYYPNIYATFRCVDN
jgi:iron(II)-dependent oxidoreductase